MERHYANALMAGTERVTAWSDLLDRINVFPVADGDTGRNMVLSLAPLKGLSDPAGNGDLIRELLLAARGNSGNIAVSFLSGFLANAPEHNFLTAVQEGKKMAWQAVPNPKRGTMLDIFATLAQIVELEGNHARQRLPIGRILDRLAQAVWDTTEQIPKLKQAGVVDSGALGMFIFFDAYFNVLNDTPHALKPIAEIFKDRLSLSSGWQKDAVSGSCIDVVVKLDGQADLNTVEMSPLVESVVALKHDDYIKVHLHADSSAEVRDAIASFGRVVQWSADDLRAQTERFSRSSVRPVLHIMTDAAGSVTRDDAFTLGFTLLDSYVTIGQQSRPETYVDPAVLYAAMQRGVKATTAQASVFERHQHYEKILGLHERALYLCVGSAFTGNLQVVMEWKKQHDPDDSLIVIDSGAASGRLGLTVLATARHSLKARSWEDVIAFAHKAIAGCEEYVFIDKLQYLVAGGRVSKASGFFGDMFGMKPVVSPQPAGVKKYGVVRNRKDQVDFALQRLHATLQDKPGIIMLEYSDNRPWMEGELQPLIMQLFPTVEIIVQPLSLTSGTHMGPGTWAVAFLPAMDGLEVNR